MNKAAAAQALFDEAVRLSESGTTLKSSLSQKPEASQDLDPGDQLATLLDPRDRRRRAGPPSERVGHVPETPNRTPRARTGRRGLRARGAYYAAWAKALDKKLSHPDHLGAQQRARRARASRRGSRLIATYLEKRAERATASRLIRPASVRCSRSPRA